MDPFKSPDERHLDAAEGWLGLGNVMEANAELNQITSALRRHPDFLAVRYKILAKAECWTECVVVAGAIADLAPKCSLGWLHRAFALHQLKQTKMALETLHPALEIFSDEIEIRQRLACYECVLGNVERAKQRLTEAMKLAKEQNCLDEWRRATLREPDLKPLWKSAEATGA
jgi:predicted Zn-dependent protease